MVYVLGRREGGGRREEGEINITMLKTFIAIQTIFTFLFS